jgi:hypothetical protein
MTVIPTEALKNHIGVVTRPAPGMLDLADWVREILE